MDKGRKDSILAHFKMIIYDWNKNTAQKYYRNDQFCMKYCIGRDQLCDRGNRCKYKHSRTIRDFIMKKDLKMAAILCLYLMYKQKNNYKFAQLYNHYGNVLKLSGALMDDYERAAKYYLRALAIDKQYGAAHNNYAVLLEYKLSNYDQAEYHYRQALKCNPNVAMRNYNLAVFLSNKRNNYSESLKYCNRACELAPQEKKYKEFQKIQTQLLSANINHSTFKYPNEGNHNKNLKTNHNDLNKFNNLNMHNNNYNNNNNSKVNPNPQSKQFKFPWQNETETSSEFAFRTIGSICFDALHCPSR